MVTMPTVPPNSSVMTAMCDLFFCSMRSSSAILMDCVMNVAGLMTESSGCPPLTTSLKKSLWWMMPTMSSIDSSYTGRRE